MRKNAVQHIPWGISFFAKRDKIVTEQSGISESFESPKRVIKEIGEASLVFCRFRDDEIDHLYAENEQAYSIDHLGRLIIAPARNLARTNLFEVMVMLSTEKKDEEDQMICNLWMKNKKPFFSTYLDLRPNYPLYSAVFFGGFTWWSGETKDTRIKKLFLPKNVHLLSNICISIDSVPRQFQRKETDEDVWDEDELYYY